MKMKRILSFVLTAAIVLSTMPISTLADSNGDLSQSTEVSENLLNDNGWTANGENLTTLDNVLDEAKGTVGKADGADTNDYVHVSIAGSGAVGPGVIYQDSNVTLKQGTKYLLSVWLRSSDIVSSDPGVTVSDKTIIIDIGNRGNALSMVGQHNGFKTLSTNTADPNNDVFFISDEWQKFNFIFETDAGSALTFAPGAAGVNGLIFRYANRGVAHQAPFDIDGLALYEVDGAYQPINGENLFTKTNDINAYFPIVNIAAHGDVKNTVTEMRTEEAHYHADSVNSGVPALVYEGLDLTPGRYTFTGDFKLSDINYEIFSGNRSTGAFFNTASLTAELDGVKIGSGTLVADKDFENIKFTVDVKMNVTDRVLTLKLSDNLDFDFKNLKLVKTYSYPVNEDWVGTNGTPISSYTSDEEYIRFSQADGGKYQFSYKAGSTLAAGDYKLSVTMRFNPEEYAENDYANYINGTKSSNSRGCLVDNGIVVGINAGTHNHNGTKNILIAGADNDVLKVTAFNKDGAASDNVYALGIDDEWHTFEIDFTLKTEQKLEHYGAISFFNNIRSDFTLPVEVLDFTLVNVATNEEYTNGIDAKYWSYRKYPISGYTFDTTVTEIFPYYTTEGTDSSAIKPVNLDEILFPGIYTVSGLMRASADNSTLTLSAGEASVSTTVGTSWKNVELKLDLRETVASDSMNIAFDCDYIDFVDFEITSENYPINENWIGPNGEVLIKVSDNNYIRFSQADGGKYQFSYKAGSTLEAGDYKLSVTMRFNPEEYAETDYANYINGTKSSNSRGCLVDNGIVVGVNAGTHNHNGTKNILIAGADNDVLTVTAFNKDGAVSDNTYALGIDDEWHTFEIDFTLKTEQKLEHFGAISFFNNIRSDFTLPVEVLDFSLVNMATNEEYTNGIDAKYWSYRKDPTSGYTFDTTVTEIFPYYTTDGSGTKTIKPINLDEILFPGIYTVSGMVRASADNSTLTLSAGDASVSATVGTAWQEIELKLDLRETVSSDVVALTFDCDYIDFSDFELTSEIYSILDSWGGPDGEALVKISDETFLQFSQANGEKYQFNYKAGDTLVPGDYTLSVTMRFDPEAYAENDYANYINGTKSESPRGCLVDNGIVVGINALTHGYPASSTLIANADNDVLKVTEFNKDGEPSANGYALDIDDEWHTFEIKFTLKQSQNVSSYGAVGFFNNIRSDFTIPVQVLDFSLVNTSDGDEYTKGLDTEYWSYNTYSNAGYDFATTVEEIPPYYTTYGMGVSSIKPMNTTAVFTPGIYKITGMFKAHGESAVLSASTVSGSCLATDYGSGSVELGNKWREVTFILDTVVAFDYSDLLINFTDDIDISYIEIELQEKHLSSDNMNRGTLITLLLLKKFKEPADGDNILGNAVSKAMLRKWSYGDQNLTYHKDADGDYFRASNITSNTLGFTYEPGTKLTAGIYFFSGEFRTANEGEITRIRVIAGGQTGISEFTNEWKKLEFVFEITRTSELSIKICGAPSALCIEDYEFRNLSLINSDDYPGGYNFFPKGQMLEESNNGWYLTSSGTPAKVTWTKEENGNIYLSVIDRTLCYTGARVNTGITLVPGAMYTVSYDIRATNPGEELTVRAKANTTDLILLENASNNAGNEYDITHEWRHVEAQFMATDRTLLYLDIIGGQNMEEDIRPFDFDNIVITKKGGATDEDLYPIGNFDNKELTLNNWGRSYGNVTITWNVENETDGYITLGDQNPVYAAGTFATTKATAGTAYIISYDIRTTAKDDKMGVRAQVNGQDIFVSHARNNYGNEYWITDEWMHVESRWVADTDDIITFAIRPGSNMETDSGKSFDINNIKIAIAP